MDIFQFIAEIANNQLKPTIVETREETNEGDTMMLKFIGYALPSCTGIEDPKWLIQLHVKYTHQSGSQIDIIGFANGVRKFDQAWEDRASLSYKPTQKSDSFYDTGELNFGTGWFTSYIPSGGDNGGGVNEL